MISKWRHNSIYTVHFKKQLFALIKRTHFSGANLKQYPLLKISRVRGLILDNELINKNPNAHLTHLFCSLALKLSANYKFVSELKQLHSHVIKLGYFEALSMQNQLLNGYVKCGMFRDVEQLFEELPVRNVVSWNILIRGVGVGRCESSDVSEVKVDLGLDYFRRMLTEMVRPDSTTMNALLRSCLELEDIGVGRMFHGFVVKVGLNSDCYVGSTAVDLYGKLGFIRDARKAFDEMEFRDLVSWNVMVSVYALNGLTEEAFQVFRYMQFEDVCADEFTFASLLSCCSSGGWCELGKQFHGLVTKLSFDLDTQLASVLVDMYAKNGCVDSSRKVFDGMVNRNLVSWNSVIVGYGQQGYGDEAMKLFADMLKKNVKPDELTAASVLSSCGNLAASAEVEQIHTFVTKIGFTSYLSVANALIGAYSNCGDLTSAWQCFNSVAAPDLVTRTSILNAHAFHGHVEDSIRIFEMMLLHGLRPDKVAFLGILSACSHGGLVQEGLHYFKLMVTEYNIPPSEEHYSCLVSLLARAGLMEEAASILNVHSFRHEPNMLGALVGASKAHGQIKLAEWAAGKLLEMEPDNPVNYTLMSNMYASVGHWGEAARIRNAMKDRCMSKVPGSSWIEISG